MTERVIRITRDLYQSLPQIYQNIAKIGEQNGKVLIVDEQDIPELLDKIPGHEMSPPGKKSIKRNTPSTGNG